MSDDPHTNPEVIAGRKRAAECEAEGQASAAQLQKDHALGLAKGPSPEQVEARKRVFKVFCEQHLPGEKPENIQALAAQIDYTQPMVSMNARGIDVNNPQAKGLLGMGRKPAYVISQQFPARSDADPIFALEYYPRKS
jgi:hypothetical protein